jgi:hypothetical protein
MSPAELEPVIPASKRPHTYALGYVLRDSDWRARAFPAHSFALMIGAVVHGTV